MNIVVLVGRISTDLNLEHVGDKQTAKCRFNLAVNRMKKDETDFIPIEVWNKIAENLVNYKSKGDQVVVEGRLQVDRYQKYGENKTFTKVIARSIEYVGGSKNNNASSDAQSDAPDGFEPVDDFGDDDGIPF